MSKRVASAMRVITGRMCYIEFVQKLVCVCCQREMGAAMRKGLRVYDNEGFWSRPFTGILCGACVAKARKFRSAKNRWLLQRIAEQTNNLRGY
jgi:hypothetical protein